jgi:SSS family solute:Na+ symporter
VLALRARRLHRVGLLAGWAVGIPAGTTMLTVNGFVSVVAVGDLQIYAALLALGLNLAVAAVLTPMLDRRGVPRGLDTTGTEALAAGTVFRGEWLDARAL